MGLLLLFSFACGGETNPASPGLPTTPTITNPPVSAAKTWTIMVYMAGDNSLSANVQPDINEMKAANSTIYNEVNIIVLRDLYGPGNTKLLKITYNNEEELSSSILEIDKTRSDNEVNTGSKYTLDKFIRYCKTYFPSTYTMLVIWNHGGGWRSFYSPVTNSLISPTQFNSNTTNSLTRLKLDPNLIDNPTTNRGNINDGLPQSTYKNACSDDNSGTILMNNDIYWSLTGNTVTILGFDACLMGMVETAYEMRNVASYLIGSEENIPGNGWNYTKLFNNFNSYGTKTALNLCKSTVDAYASEYSSTPYTTLSAIDLSKMNSLNTAINSFATALASKITSYTIAFEIQDIFILYTESYKDSSKLGDWNLDLWHAADRIQNLTDYCDAEAAALKTAITNAVIYEWHHASGHPNSHGLSIYLMTASGWNDVNSNGIVDAGEISPAHDNRYSDTYSGSDKIQFLSASTWGLGVGELLRKLFYVS